MAPPVAGYFAWYDATAIGGTADGSLLSSWSDGSGNGHTLTSSGSSRPTYYNTTSAKLINGLPAVWFVSGAQTMDPATYSQNQPMTWFVVALTTTPASTQMPMGDSNGNGPQLLYVSSKYEGFAGTALSGGTVDTNPHVICWVINTTTSLVAVDGITVASGNSGSQNSTQKIGLGENLFNGAAGEAICYPSALSGTDQTSVNNYLINKWLTAPPPAYAPPQYRRSFVPQIRASHWRKRLSGLVAPERGCPDIRLAGG